MTVFPTSASGTYNSIKNNYTIIEKQILSIGTLFNTSVVNGAIKINTTAWEMLLGYNQTLNSTINFGFQRYLENFLTFWEIIGQTKDHAMIFTMFDSYKTESEIQLHTLSGKGIFLSLSEELN